MSGKYIHYVDRESFVWKIFMLILFLSPMLIDENFTPMKTSNVHESYINVWVLSLVVSHSLAVYLYAAAAAVTSWHMYLCMQTYIMQRHVITSSCFLHFSALKHTNCTYIISQCCWIMSHCHASMSRHGGVMIVYKVNCKHDNAVASTTIIMVPVL